MKINPLIIFNWKENPNTLSRAESLASFVIGNAHKNFHVVIAPPMPFLVSVGNIIASQKFISLGAQDVSAHEAGSHTGDTSADMLKNVGVKYVIVGHSERRFGDANESDTQISKKVALLCRKNIAPILCVGEKHKKTIQKAFKIVQKQLTQGLAHVKKNSHIVIAYEPVWAIGGNKQTDARHSFMMINMIRKWLTNKKHTRFKILYGGSISKKTITTFAMWNDVDGLLVGSAGLHQDEIKSILNKSLYGKR